MSVDDAPLVREGFAPLLREEGIAVLAQYADFLGIVAAVADALSHRATRA